MSSRSPNPAMTSLGMYAYDTTQRPLGEGSFAIVLLGYDTTGTPVAIKRIRRKHVDSPQQRQQINLEVNILRSIEHPNIVRLLDCVVTPELDVYLVMEHCRGGDMHKYLETAAPLPPAVAGAAAAQLALAVAYLHARHVLHRDLKPHNVLLAAPPPTPQAAPWLKLADFGFARELAAADALAATVCGSPLYMAPEVLHRRPYGPAADMWSLGVMLYQCLTGRLPYQAAGLVELTQLLRRPPPPAPLPADTPPALAALVADLLVSDPARRLAAPADVVRHPAVAAFAPAAAAVVGVSVAVFLSLDAANDDDDDDDDGTNVTTDSNNGDVAVNDTDDNDNSSNTTAPAVSSSGSEPAAPEGSELRSSFVVLDKQRVELDAVADALAASSLNSWAAAPPGGDNQQTTGDGHPAEPQALAPWVAGLAQAVRGVAAAGATGVSAAVRAIFQQVPPSTGSSGAPGPLGLMPAPRPATVATPANAEAGLAAMRLERIARAVRAVLHAAAALRTAQQHRSAALLSAKALALVSAGAAAHLRDVLPLARHPGVRPHILELRACYADAAAAVALDDAAAAAAVTGFSPALGSSDEASSAGDGSIETLLYDAALSACREAAALESRLATAPAEAAYGRALVLFNLLRSEHPDATDDAVLQRCVASVQRRLDALAPPPPPPPPQQQQQQLPPPQRTSPLQHAVTAPVIVVRGGAALAAATAAANSGVPGTGRPSPPRLAGSPHSPLSAALLAPPRLRPIPEGGIVVTVAPPSSATARVFIAPASAPSVRAILPPPQPHSSHSSPLPASTVEDSMPPLSMAPSSNLFESATDSPFAASLTTTVTAETAKSQL